MWANLMGRGIVQPADQIDSRQHASHPELLEWLAHDFEQSGYDVKRLERNIVTSRAYQLDSKPSTKITPRPESFATRSRKTSLSRTTAAFLADRDREHADKRRHGTRTDFRFHVPDLMADNYNPSCSKLCFFRIPPYLMTCSSLCLATQRSLACPLFE